MGENEQGGMLRTVVVIGIIAMVALIITLGVVGLKSNMSKNTDKAVGTVVTTTIPYGVKNPNIVYAPDNSSEQVNTYWGNHMMYFPKFGDVPANSWREVHIVLNSDKKMWFKLDINNNPETPIKVGNSISNDNDRTASRVMNLYRNDTGAKVASTYGDLSKSTYIEPNVSYTVVIKYFNKLSVPFYEPDNTSQNVYYSILYTGIDDNSQYKLNVDSFEAATYDDKYNS